MGRLYWREILFQAVLTIIFIVIEVSGPLILQQIVL